MNCSQIIHSGSYQYSERNMQHVSKNNIVWLKLDGVDHMGQVIWRIQFLSLLPAEIVDRSVTCLANI